MHTNKKLLKSIFSFALVIMMFLSISIMAGCSSKEAVVMEKETDNNSNNQSTANLSSSIIGTWVAASGDPDFALKFYSDGTCDIKSEDARDEAYMYYTVNGDQLTLYKFNKTDSRTFSCRIEGDTMYVDGSEIYVRSQ